MSNNYILHTSNNCNSVLDNKLISDEKSGKNEPLRDLNISGSSLCTSSKCFVNWVGEFKSVMQIGQMKPSRICPSVVIFFLTVDVYRARFSSCKFDSLRYRGGISLFRDVRIRRESSEQGSGEEVPNITDMT